MKGFVNQVWVFCLQAVSRICGPFPETLLPPRAGFLFS
jgi:hypothetical protein